MNLPFSSIHKLIDSLTRSNASFALYRQPWTDEPLLVLQEAGGAQTVDGMSGLNGKRGFLMAPFKPGGKHPIVLIEADHCAHGWESISDLLAQYAQTHAAEIPAPPAGPLQPSAGQEPGQETGGQDQEAYAEAFGRFIVPLRQKHLPKAGAVALPALQAAQRLLPAFRVCERVQQLSADDDIAGAHAGNGNVDRKHARNHPERARHPMAYRIARRHHADAGRHDARRMERGANTSARP